MSDDTQNNNRRWDNSELGRDQDASMVRVEYSYNDPSAVELGC